MLCGGGAMMASSARMVAMVFLIRLRCPLLLPSLPSCFEQDCLFASLADPGIVAEERVNALLEKTLTFSPHHVVCTAIFAGHLILSSPSHQVMSASKQKSEQYSARKHQKPQNDEGRNGGDGPLDHEPAHGSDAHIYVSNNDRLTRGWHKIGRRLRGKS